MNNHYIITSNMKKQYTTTQDRVDRKQYCDISMQHELKSENAFNI